MGALLTTRQQEGIEEVDIGANHAYKYPPRSGNYFGSHFIMGGERFDTPQPESYLFGENSDLNFLGSRPTPFPYPPPQPNEPTKTLKSLVNIRKESLRFVRITQECSKLSLEKSDHRDVELGANTLFNIEFTFDCDVRCAITIYYFCAEEITQTGVTVILLREPVMNLFRLVSRGWSMGDLGVSSIYYISSQMAQIGCVWRLQNSYCCGRYIPRDPSMTSETFLYDRGANQLFCQVSHVFNPSKYTDDDLLYDVDKEIIPIAIHCVADEGPEEMRQSHTTIATVEKITDGTYLFKALKQKLFVDGLCYLLQEIYGIENKSNDKTDDDDPEDNGSECVICMCDVRDTLILPCRHLCLCNSCADSLRYQANNCPICRAPFRALLQIRALQKCGNSNLAPISPAEGSCDNIPPGYEAVSLIEALNGPCAPRQPPSAMPDLVETPDNENAIQAAQILNRQCDRTTPPRNRGDDLSSPDYGVTVLMTPRRSEESTETTKCPLLSDTAKLSRKIKSRDSVVLVNEKVEKEENADEDSEAEKLSPLLQKNNGTIKTSNLPLNMADVVDSIDDADTDQEDQPSTSAPERSKNYSERGDESDYYTPDEPTPITGPLYEGNGSSSVESTPQRMPGTPHSHASVRSSADSYTSGSSTRHLLAVVKAGTTNSDKSVNV